MKVFTEQHASVYWATCRCLLGNMQVFTGQHESVYWAKIATCKCLLDHMLVCKWTNSCKCLLGNQALSQLPVHPSFVWVKIGLDRHKLCRGVIGRVPKYLLNNNSFP